MKIAFENNRIVSVERGKYIQIQKFEGWSSTDMQTMYLKDYGMVKVCRLLYKKVYRYYIMSTAELNNLESKHQWILKEFMMRIGALKDFIVQLSKFAT